MRTQNCWALLGTRRGNNRRAPLKVLVLFGRDAGGRERIECVGEGGRAANNVTGALGTM